MAQAATLWIFSPDSGATISTEVFDLALATPARLLAHLQQSQALEREDSDRPWELFAEGKRLAPQASFLEQGIVTDTHVEVARRQIAQHGGRAGRTA
jgi:hypothetical protein